LITLYSYPSLFGVADNNGYGLKVFAFLRLLAVMHQRFGKPASTLPQYARGVPFVLEHMSRGMCMGPRRPASIDREPRAPNEPDRPLD
jgi:hypothetical protein